MDNTNIDFEYSIEQIKRPIVTDYNMQQIYLNSEDINNGFKNMENSLNILYENTRYLEDAISYCDAFLNLKIKEYSQDIQELLKGIENIRDINKNSAYIEYICNFKDDLSIKKDRDNSNISNTLLKENSLLLGIKSEKEINYSYISKQSSYIPYSNNLDNIKIEPYRTYYIEEKIANKGITETLTITLDEPTEINYINIEPINAEIKNLRLVYVNGIEDDIWNKIKEYEFKYALDFNSKLELDEVIARIHEDKTEIYQTNISNKDNIVEKQMYSYLFGIDSINIKNIKQEKDSCFISESINVGSLKENEYLQLIIESIIDENSVVEYSILDGNVEVPILPYGTKIIKNERLFASQSLRFTQDSSLAHTIKKDGMTIDISLDDAKSQLLNRFSIDYFPEKKYNYTPINSNIKIKATIRNFSNSINNSYIRTIKIRKYGGDVPWTDM